MGPMRVVVEHPRKGLFLGFAVGKAWWTNCPMTVNISEVVTFPTLEHAQIFVITHFSDAENIAFHELDINDNHAPIPVLVAAGLGHHCQKLLWQLPTQGHA